MLQFVNPTLYVKPVKQITFLCHSIKVTSGMTDCSDDRLEEFKLDNKLFTVEKFFAGKMCAGKIAKIRTCKNFVPQGKND